MTQAGSRVTGMQIGRRRLALREPFATSRGSATDVLAVEFTVTASDGATGVGWASPATRLTGETLGSIEAALAGPLKDTLEAVPFDEHAELLRRLHDVLPGNRAAKAAVDVALHSLWAQQLGTTLPVLLGTRRNEVATDITVSNSSVLEMVAAATRRRELGFRTLKVKVGGELDRAAEIDRIVAIAEVAEAGSSLRLDANQGWARHEAVAILSELADRDVRLDFVEQPVAAWDLDGMRWVREHCPYPIMADESVASAIDVRRVADAGAADMVNLKLTKCGGIAAVQQAAAVADAAALPAMIGSMLEMPEMVGVSVAVAATRPWREPHDLDAGWWLDPQSADGGWPRYSPPLVRWDATSAAPD